MLEKGVTSTISGIKGTDGLMLTELGDIKMERT